MTDDPNGNGRFRAADDDDAVDDDGPLSPDEAVEAAAAAEADTDETLDERVESVIEDLDGVERHREGEAVIYVAGGRVFAVLLPDVLETALDPVVAAAALRTPHTMASTRGTGWVAFTPEDVDRFVLDRAEAWVRSAHRRATGA